MNEKPVVWLGDSRGDHQGFPEGRPTGRGIPAVACTAGTGGERLETDAERGVGGPGDSYSYRRGASSALRRQVRRGVYVLHAFEKRTRRTLKEDLSLAKQRFRLLINQ